MTKGTITNEQLDQKLNLILEHLKFHEKRLDHLEMEVKEIRKDMNRQFKEVREDMDRRFTEVDRQFKEVRTDIGGLSNTRLTWSAGVLGGVTVASAILVLILSRLLGSVGFRIVESGGTTLIS